MEGGLLLRIGGEEGKGEKERGKEIRGEGEERVKGAGRCIQVLRGIEGHVATYR